MKKSLILVVVGCFVVSLLSVGVLTLLSQTLRENKNSFLRLFPPHVIEEGDTMNVKYDSYYFAGGTDHHIYLANSTAPLHLLVLSTTLKDSIHVKLDIKGFGDEKFWYPRVTVDSPYFYVTDGTIPVIFKGNVNTWHGEKCMPAKTYFREIVPLSGSSFAIKSLARSNGENRLGKISEAPPHKLFCDTILQKQLDGVFCTDGILRYNRDINRLIYLYYYRNQFMVMDSSLKLIYRGHTIDTNTVAKIKTATIESEHARTWAAPPFLVNKGYCLSGQWLFVLSNLTARNESRRVFDKNSVVDVYGISQGKYAFSFYIPDYRGRKLSEFRVLGSHLVARYDSTLRVFDIVPRYFEQKGSVSDAEPKKHFAKSGGT